MVMVAESPAGVHILKRMSLERTFLTRVHVVRQQLCDKRPRLRVLEDGDGVRVQREQRRVVVDVLYRDVDVGLAVAPSSVHRPHFEPVLLLLLSVQRPRGL